MAKMEKVTASIDSNVLHSFEEMRKKYGKDNRSKEIQKAIEMRLKQWKRQEFEKECEEASREIGFDIRESYEVQGEALESRS